VDEMVKEAAGITDDDNPGAAAAKLASLPSAEERGVVAERLSQVLGLAEATAPAEEIAWAFRKLLEALSRARPVVAVFDDVQWAEPTLVDLIDHVTDWSRDAPILLITIARQELLDTHPGWGGGKRNTTTIQLEPLTDQNCGELVENLLGRAMLPVDAKSRIAEAAEGNPLLWSRCYPCSSTTICSAPTTATGCPPSNSLPSQSLQRSMLSWPPDWTGWAKRSAKSSNGHRWSERCSSRAPYGSSLPSPCATMSDTT
jgi:hypothetical protein